MSWDVQLVDDVGGSDNVVLKVHKGVPDDAYRLRNESLCVDEGLNEFNIHGKGGIRYPGYYDVRVFGELVTRGDEFDCSATITFAIPLSAAPAMMPSATLQPNLSFSSSTTSSPPIASTESPLPTLTCTPIYVILNLG
jgi:hypothetical protein